MTHIKRLSAPSSWSIERKNKKYLVVPRSSHPLKYSLPIRVLLRDILKFVTTAKESKKIVKEGNVFVDNRIVYDDKRGVGIFDRIYIKKLEKYYSIILTKNKKLIAKEIDQEEYMKKPCKIIGKKILKNKRIQINLYDGKNFITKEKMKINDSVIFDLKENKVTKYLPLAVGSKVFIIKGNNIGEFAKIDEIKNEKKSVILNINKNKIEVPIKNIFVVEE